MSNPTITHSPVVLYHTQIGYGKYDSPGCLSICKDFIKGYRGHYFVYQVDDGYYVCILADEVTSVSVNGTSASFASPSAKVYDIFIESQESDISIDFSGRGSGSFAGVSPSPSAGDWSGSLSGSSTVFETDYTYFYTVRYNQNVSLYNPNNCLCYSDLDGFPHLVEGVEYYANAAFILCFGIIAFRLLDRIFRRIY